MPALKKNWEQSRNDLAALVGAFPLEFKHLLACLVAQHCPEVMPVTYSVNDENWISVLNQLADKIWILKPALLNNGKHIKIFKNLGELEQHYLSANRMGGEHVIQEYLTHSHLLKGHKYSIRMFVTVTNYAESFIYPNGYLNVSVKPYQSQQFQDLSSHLTNEHLIENISNVVQIPSQRFDLFPGIYQQIKIISTQVISGLRKLNPQAFTVNKQRTLAIFGFDFLVDANLRVWLLEANHGPCFPMNDEHPLQKHLYYNFWQAFIESFVLPIATRQSIDSIEYKLFESLT